MILWKQGTSLYLQRFDEGTGVEATLEEHNIMWYKSCYQKCETYKLQRAEKRNSQAKDTVTEGTS